ncbi:MAG: hypothetical protein GX535_13990 [Xanthomonadaceae bacterium]|nr:hypothetical protein [Xanthomonadaceae bacterium]
MNSRLLVLCAALACIGTASTPADDFSISAEVNGVGMEAKSERETPRKTKASCTAQCNSAHARCGSQVRRARQQCSRVAVTGGRESFEPYQDPEVFCAYFRRPRNCGPGCEARFAQHFAMCMKAVDNPASMRQDCMDQERQAQNFCRQELRECEMACRS